MLRKSADYAGLGIQNTFVVDPRTELFYRYQNGSFELCREPVSKLSGSAAEVDWAAVSALRD
jgi:hypothetical protein